MNPENPRTASYLAAMSQEIVRQYDVDGIHLDYIRYPEQWRVRGSADRARGHITAIVRAIHQAVKSEKPWVKMSCSPIGKFADLSRYKSGGWNAYARVFQDARAWLKEGLMDDDFTSKVFNSGLSLVPAMTWQDSIPPASPKDLSVTRASDATVVSWQPADAASADSTSPLYTYYNVYASRQYPVDIEDAAHLIAIRLPAPQPRARRFLLCRYRHGPLWQRE